MKALIRSVISWMLVHLRFLDLLVVLNGMLGRRVMILGFHRVKDPARDPASIGLISLYVSPTNFERLIDCLRRHFRIVSMNDYLEWVTRGESIPGNCAVLTFDDGYEDFVTRAIPSLVRETAPGTLFVASGRGEDTKPAWWDLAYNLLWHLTIEHRGAASNSLGTLIDVEFLSEGLFASREERPTAKQKAIISLIKELQTFSKVRRQEILDRLINLVPLDMKHFEQTNRFMTDDELVAASHAGIDIQGHTVSHSFLTEVTDETIEYELLVSRQQLETLLDKKIIGFAYPGGRYSPNVKRRVKECGYSYGMTIDFGLNSRESDLFELKRVMVSNDVLTDVHGEFDEKAFAWLYLRATLSK